MSEEKRSEEERREEGDNRASALPVCSASWLLWGASERVEIGATVLRLGGTCSGVAARRSCARDAGARLIGSILVLI